MSEQFKQPIKLRPKFGYPNYSALIVGSMFFVAVLACTPPVNSQTAGRSSVAVSPAARDISAQGRIMPHGGIVQIGALPGDRIEDVLVEIGETVEKGTVLVKMRSEQLRVGELEMLRTKMLEAIAAVEAKKTEASLNVQAALNRQQQALSAQQQADEQLRLVETQTGEEENGQLVTARRQLEVLTALREDPLTRPMIGRIELDARRAELSKLESTLQSTKLTAVQAVESAGLAARLAQHGITAAEKAAELIDSASPIDTLRKQIELLEKQIEESRITAPCTGTVLSRNGKPGELVNVLPILEFADLEKMVCLAEVNEADIGRVKVGDVAVLTSAGLPKNIRGKVARIDPMVGVPIMRSPNPMARTDFRAVTTVIEIDPELIPIAAKRVQLQVDVSIVKDHP